MALLALLISALALLISSITGLSDAGAPSEPAPDLGEQATASEATELETEDGTWEYEGYAAWGPETDLLPTPLLGQLWRRESRLFIPRFREPCGISEQESLLEFTGPIIRHGLLKGDPIPTDLLQELQETVGGVYTDMLVDPYYIYVYGKETVEGDEPYAIAAYVAYAFLVDEGSVWNEEGPTWLIEYTAQRWDCSHPRYAETRGAGESEQQASDDVPSKNVEENEASARELLLLHLRTQPPGSVEQLVRRALVSEPYVDIPGDTCTAKLESDFSAEYPQIAHGLSSQDAIPEDLLAKALEVTPGGNFSSMTLDEMNVYLFGKKLSEDGSTTIEAYAAQAVLFDGPSGWAISWRAITRACHQR